jgi:hypothetical protein
MSISTQFSLLKTFSDKIWLAQDSVQIGKPVLQLGFHLEQFATNSAEFCTESARSKVTNKHRRKSNQIINNAYYCLCYLHYGYLHVRIILFSTLCSFQQYRL